MTKVITNNQTEMNHKPKKPNRFLCFLKRRLYEQKQRGVLFNILSIIVLIWGLSLTYVFIWGFNVSCTNIIERANNLERFFPKNFTFENYVEIFHAFDKADMPYFNMVWNSIWFSLGTTLFRLLSTICFAYVIARYNFKLRKFLYLFVLIQLMLPIYGQTVANYTFLYGLGLTDSPLFLLAMGAGHGMYFLIVHDFFLTLPKDYSEAAQIDGAGHMRIFVSVMLPMIKPMALAMGILTFISCWNDYSTTLLYLPNWPTLSSGLYKLKSAGIEPVIRYAGIFLSALPIILIFAIFNKKLMNNISFGGIKG